MLIDSAHIEDYLTGTLDFTNKRLSHRALYPPTDAKHVLKFLYGQLPCITVSNPIDFKINLHGHRHLDKHRRDALDVAYQHVTISDGTELT